MVDMSPRVDRNLLRRFRSSCKSELAYYTNSGMVYLLLENWDDSQTVHMEGFCRMVKHRNLSTLTLHLQMREVRKLERLMKRLHPFYEDYGAQENFATTIEYMMFQRLLNDGVIEPVCHEPEAEGVTEAAHSETDGLIVMW